MIALMTLQQSNERPSWGNLQFLAIGMRWVAQLQHPSALPVDSIMPQEGIQNFTGETFKSAIGLPFEVFMCLVPKADSDLVSPFCIVETLTSKGKHASPSSCLHLY